MKILIILLSLVVLIPLIYLYAANSDEVDIRIHILVGTLCFGYLVFDVIKRKRRGQSWNEALAQGNKLITGNVWKDAGLLFIILLCIFILPIAIAYIVLWP